MATIDDICACRDAALAALGVSANGVGDEIAQTTVPGPHLDQLTRRYQELMDKRAAIRTAATDEILALPGILAAADALAALSTQMRDTAAALPRATDLLTGSAVVLSLGQQFAETIANAQGV